MARYRTTVSSDRPPGDAFAYMAAFENVQTWDPGVVEAQRLTPGEVGVGSTFRVVVSSAGRRLPLEYRVRDLDPGRRIVLVAETATLRSVDEITVEQDGSGSQVTYDADLELTGALRWFNPLLGLFFNRIGDRARDGLRREIGR